MKKKSFFTLFLLLNIIEGVFAGNKTISGKLIDKKSNEVLAYAYVSVISSDSTALGGILTNDQGRFELTIDYEGKAILHCAYMGYKTLDKSFWMGEKNEVFDFGKVTLEPSTQALGEVTVQGESQTVSASLAKKSFSMDENISQGGGTVLDAMRNMPGVTLDSEGKVLLRGSDKVAILVDGKQSSLTGFGNQSGLDNIPASNIEKIEIINNPSAKYESNGMAGVINIVYKKDIRKGWNGELGFNFGLGEWTQQPESLPNLSQKYSYTPKSNPFFRFNYRINDALNFFLQADGMFRHKVNCNEFTTRDYVDEKTPDVNSQFLENRSQQLYNIKAGGDWNITTSDLFTAFVLYEDEYHIDRGDVPYDYVSNGERYRLWQWRETENTRFTNMSLNYEHQFAQPGHKMNLGYLYTNGSEDEIFSFSDKSDIRDSKDTTHCIVKEIVSKIDADYVKPLEHGKIEAGSDIRLRKIPITYDIMPGINSILDPKLGDWSRYNENIYGLYGNYLLETKTVDLEAGLRLEQTHVTYKIDEDNAYYLNNDDYKYFSLFPNVRLTGKVNQNNRFSFFYNRRVDRPEEFDLRPFPKYDDPEILKTGNPYLRPQFTQTWEFSYKTLWNTGSVYASVFYRKTEDIFARIYTKDTLNNIINTIPQNLGNGSNLGFELNVEQKLYPWWNANASFSWYKNRIDAFEGIAIYPYEQPFVFEEEKNNTWNIKINSNWTLPKQWMVQGTFIYYAPDIVPQGTVDKKYSLDFGIKKRAFNDKLEFSLAATDITNRFKTKQTIYDKEFTLRSENYEETQVFTLGVKYKL